MPEGPEVTRTARQLDDAVRSNLLSHVRVVSGRYTKKLPEGYDAFINMLNTPKQVRGVFNKGKFIWWDLGDAYIFSTLGMSGHYKLIPDKHTRVAFYFEDDAAVYYNDQRNFGTLKFVFSAKELQSKLQAIGPDMLNDPPTVDTFVSIASKKPKWSVVKWLMDQTQISGVGNIYKSESLFLAGIRPDRLMETLSTQELHKLHKAICTVLSSSYENGGATIRNYTDLYDNHGLYTDIDKLNLMHKWENRVMIYGRNRDIYGNLVMKVTLDDGRTTYWTPEVQF